MTTVSQWQDAGPGEAFGVRQSSGAFAGTAGRTIPVRETAKISGKCELKAAGGCRTPRRCRAYGTGSRAWTWYERRAKLRRAWWLTAPTAKARHFQVLLSIRPGGITSVVMNTIPPSARGRVASLHLHPPVPGAPLYPVDSMEVIAAQGIAGERRYFGRIKQSTGKPNRRQVTLIEREQLAQHAAMLALEQIPPGAARSNIETQGVDLMAFIGRQVEIGGAVLLLYEPR